VRRQEANGEGKGGQRWSVYVGYVCENRTMKPVHSLRKKEGDEGE
jgi:hypothetical protein